MKRREFIQYSAITMLMAGCDFEYNANQVDTDVKNLNTRNISLIQNMPLSYPITIALISDTHNYYTKLKNTIDKIKSDISSYDFVIHGGDITDAGLQKEFDDYHSFRNDLPLPVVHSIGNHDAITNGITIFRNIYGDYNFTFQIAQTHFIFFNNNNWEFGNKPLNLTWLESKLSAAKTIIDSDGAGQIIVVNHVNYNSNERYTATEIAKYIQLMTDYNVTLSMNGHNHGHEIHSNGIEYLTIGSVQHDSFIKLTLNSASQLDYTLEQVYV